MVISLNKGQTMTIINPNGNTIETPGLTDDKPYWGVAATDADGVQTATNKLELYFPDYSSPSNELEVDYGVNMSIMSYDDKNKILLLTQDSGNKYIGLQFKDDNTSELVAVDSDDINPNDYLWVKFNMNSTAIVFSDTSCRIQRTGSSPGPYVYKKYSTPGAGGTTPITFIPSRNDALSIGEVKEEQAIMEETLENFEEVLERLSDIVQQAQSMFVCR